MEVIREVDLNKIEPWDLQERCKIGSTPQNEWYFFSHKDRKYPTGSRTNRATSAGFWKATGRDKCIRNSFMNKIGMRKTLVFYRGRAPHGHKTDWIMHEYRLEDNIIINHHHPQSSSSSSSTTTTTDDEGWVVCRVFKKKNLFKVNGNSTTSTEGGAAAVNNNMNNMNGGMMMMMMNDDDHQLNTMNINMNMNDGAATASTQSRSGGGGGGGNTTTNNNLYNLLHPHGHQQASSTSADHHHLNYINSHHHHIPPALIHHHQQHHQYTQVEAHDFISNQSHMINRPPSLMLTNRHHDLSSSNSPLPTTTSATATATDNYDQQSPRPHHSMQVKQFMSTDDDDDSCHQPIISSHDQLHLTARSDDHQSLTEWDPLVTSHHHNPNPIINPLSLRSEMDFWSYGK
ncbi:hypothetical protein ACP275_03G134000 [Erythranthe tilingii]